MKRDWLTPLVLGVALLAGVYVAAYFLLARPGVTIGLGLGRNSFPDYHGLPPTLFEPLHALDKRYFRSSKWSGSPPRKMRNGSASLKDVYAWANSLLGTNYPLETIHADLFHDGSDVLFVAQPGWGGTSGNDYFAFRRTPKGWRFLGDIWFGGFRVLTSDPEGRPRILTSSSAGGGRCSVSLYVLERNGFHETMTRKNLPCGDAVHAEGQDQLYRLLFDSETVTEESLQLVFGDPATVDFSGSIKAGKRFERTFGGRFIFTLEPIDCGWEICIYERGRTENIARLTPPFHFVPNPRHIEGWHFRNENNTGPNDGIVNAPQEQREFIFSPEVGRTIDGPQASYAVTTEAADRVEAFGHGHVQITHRELSPPQAGEKARILAMKFRCTIVWRQKALEEMTANTGNMRSVLEDSRKTGVQ